MAEKSGRLAGAVRAAGVTVVPAHAAGALADSQPARVSTTRAATAPPRAMYLTSISRAPLSTGGFRSGARHASTLPALPPDAGVESAPPLSTGVGGKFRGAAVRRP